MRGSVLEYAENMRALYYDLVPKKTKSNNGIDKSSGKYEYEYSKLPKTFKFSETSISGATVFQSLKGFEMSATSFGDVFQTKSYKLKIQTSNTEIEFKEKGKVVIEINGRKVNFTIQKITYLTAYNKGISATRIGQKKLDLKKLPKVLELA